MCGGRNVAVTRSGHQGFLVSLHVPVLGHLLDRVELGVAHENHRLHRLAQGVDWAEADQRGFTVHLAGSSLAELHHLVVGDLPSTRAHVQVVLCGWVQYKAGRGSSPQRLPPCGRADRKAWIWVPVLLPRRLLGPPRLLGSEGRWALWALKSRQHVPAVLVQVERVSKVKVGVVRRWRLRANLLRLVHLSVQGRPMSRWETCHCCR